MQSLAEDVRNGLRGNMKKSWQAVIIIIIIVVGAIAYYSVTSSGNTTSTTSTTPTCLTPTTNTASSTSPSTNTAASPAKVSGPIVGAFLYLWYGFNQTSMKWTGGLGTSHWNTTDGTVVDEPSIGYYPSDSNATLAWQLSNMKTAGITAIAVSWWGPGNNTTQSGDQAVLDSAINNATLNLFRYLESTKGQWNFKVAIMVEGFNSKSYAMTPEDYIHVYGYLEKHYYRPYSDLILNWQGKPLVMFFNTKSMNQISEVPANSSYAVRLVGGYPNGVNWYFWEGMNFLDSSGGTNVNTSDYERSPMVSPDGEVGVIPRYDDYYLHSANPTIRTGYMRFDYDLSEGMYSSEWNYVIREAGNVKLVLLDSWNEYHERTSLEPRQDFTAKVNSTYLQDLTARYISSIVAVSKATAYLASNYNPSVGLIPETNGSRNYWLYSDNCLATLALRQVGFSNSSLMAIAANISATIQFYAPRLGDSTNQYMVLNGSWSGPCAFDSAHSYKVAQSPNFQINVTLNNGTGTLSDSDYADIAFLTAICLQHRGNYDMALNAFNQGVKFFNGTGFADWQFTSPGPTHAQYQTYKLALCIYAGRLLLQPVNQAVMTTLLKMQATDGGFYTGYNSDLTHGNTKTNTETTSLAILALSS